MINNKPQAEPHILNRLASVLGTGIKNHRLEIPEKFGKGYCTGFVFNDHIRMHILNYELYEDVVIENPDMNAIARTILFKFQNVFPATEITPVQKRINATPSVLIVTSSLNTDAVIPIHSNTSIINIEVDAGYLNGLFDLHEKSPVLQSLLQNTKPLLFEQMIHPALQPILDEIVNQKVNETFKLFFLRVKAEELICRLLMELEKRDEQQLYNLNGHDIQTLYKVKAQMLKNLATPPVINQLAVYANMSPTKLKRLFKQIFGNSIFNYYQNIRMKKAALLLKAEKLSVSDTGYKLGFTNLSHFARVFEQHIGMKPKQYSRL